MDKQKNKEKEIKKKTKVVKEQDVVKERDYEDSNDGKKIVIVALILALLIGGLAYVRSLDNNKKDKDDKIEEPIDKEKKPEEEKPVEKNNEENTNTDNNYQPTVTTNKNEEVDIWKALKSIPNTLEAGEVITLPEIATKDNGGEIKAVVSYKFRSNSNDEYTNVSELDTTKIGEYVVTYTLNYKDGKVETREIEITISDTTEPVINNVSDGLYYNQDILLDITEYSPYIVELNGTVYDATVPIADDGEYTLVVTEDIENGKSIQVTFTIDKTAPEIVGVENNAYYNSPVLINIEDANIDNMLLTKDGEEISFANGLTNIEEDGSYQITATDKAGNETSYSFTIDTKLPEIEVTYAPNNTELTNGGVTVTITANKELQEVEGWELSSDKLTLTKEFTENTDMVLEVKDLAGNIANANIYINNIDYNVSYDPSLTLENLVANKVKATITSLKQLILDDTWTEKVENGMYKYEKIYSESGIEVVNYEDIEGNVGSIEININIELNDLFVTYYQDEQTQDVTAYVTTEEEVTEVPDGWTLDDEYLGEGYRYYKVYTDNVAYEMVEFITENNNYVATIVIDSIDKEAPVAEADVTYIKENDEKQSVVVTVTANEEINNVEGWSLSEDKKSIVKIEEKPETVPNDDQNESVTITDLKGNETTVEYTYNWNE